MVTVGFEHKKAPCALQESVKRAGGFNIYGWPMFRVVWGYSRLALLGGELNEFDERGTFIRKSVGYRMEHPPGYKWDRWHIEKWMPPEFYGSPEHWAEINSEWVDGVEYSILGPYPRQGDYELSTIIEDAAEQFLPLTPAVCETIIRSIEWARGLHPTQRRAAIERREEKKEKSWSDYCDDVMDDCVPAFQGQAHVPVRIQVINDNKPAFPALQRAARKAGMIPAKKHSILEATA